MPTTYPSAPYYDDFSVNNKFYRIMFKPGFPVQARELTQLQTILQNQIEKFGDHVFKEGSIVIPGNTYLDKNYKFVKLQTTVGATEIADYVASLEGRVLEGQTSGVQAKVVKVTVAENSDPDTLYVKYTSAGSNNTDLVFADNEVLTTIDTGTSYSVQAIASNATGRAYAVTINRGIYFIKGVFALVNTQTIVLDKYSASPSYRVGLSITEEIIDSVADSTLLDPAVGTFNYFAPGADRYKLDLTLVKRGIDATVTSDKFIELLTVQDGYLLTQINKPGYNILADELARRTYDESGNYTVDTFKLRFIEHLQSTTNPDGYLPAANGGDSSLHIAVASPGKAYVKGYEVETIGNRYLAFNKPRDKANITNAIIRTPIGNYVETSNNISIPNFTTDLTKVQLYNRYTATKGTAAGTLVGNARVRGVDTGTGNIMLDASTIKHYMFDVEMKPGFSFKRDAKQIFAPAVASAGYNSAAFTGDISPTSTSIPGTVTVTGSDNTISGVNTYFTGNLKVGDYVTFTTDTSNSYRVTVITDNTSLDIDRDYPLTTTSGVTLGRQESVIQEANTTAYLYEFPKSVIDNISDVTYRTRRVFFDSLSSGNVDLSTGVNTTFASRSDTEYFAVVASGGRNGELIRITSDNFEFTDAPTNRNIRIKLTSHGLTTEDVLVYSTIIKSNPTVKTKTTTANTIEYTSQTDCQSPSISLQHADVYEIANVRMSSNTFGTDFYDPGSIDITGRYTLDDGQKQSYYGVSKISLKPGAAKPTGPIQINVNYYDHGSGDYFDESSYPDYENIPEVTFRGKTYSLRDVIDFRSRIADDGDDFNGTGSSITQFLDFNNDFQCDFEHYLPRIDKIYLSSAGTMIYKEGTSSENPVEPSTPEDSMALYVIEHPAYGFNISNDSSFKPVDQKRFTMKDIGRLESRIRNLEYYTSLSILELDTALFSIKDTVGLDRFKNGFVVDNFRSHGVGDVTNEEYNVSIDFDKGELRPSFFQKEVKLQEQNFTSAQRTANNYTKVNASGPTPTIMLPYTEESYINLSGASSDEPINPFEVFAFVGAMDLEPPGVTFHDTTNKPLVYQNDNGEFDTFVPDSVGEKVYGSVWNSWKSLWFGEDDQDKNRVITDSVSGSGIVFANTDTLENAKNVVIPYIPAVNIKFTATKLKPNTKYYVFFNEYDLTEVAFTANSTPAASNVSLLSNNPEDVVTNANGTVTGFLNYSPITTGVLIPTGRITLRLTESQLNNAEKGSFVDATFVADGSLSYISPPHTNFEFTPSTPATFTGTQSAITTQSGVQPQVTFDTDPALADYAVAWATNDGGTLPTVIDVSGKRNTFIEAALEVREGEVFVSDEDFATYSPDSVDYSGTLDIQGTNSYNLKSGATTGLDEPLAGTGTSASDYYTATNILTATNQSTGKTFVEDIKDEVVTAAGGGDDGDKAWSTVVSTYDGVKAVVAEQVYSDAGATAAQLDFWDAGVKNGDFDPNDPGAVDKAIEAYAAATTYSYINSGSTSGYGGKASASAASNGIK